MSEILHHFLKSGIRNFRRKMRMGMLIILTLSIGFITTFYVYSYLHFENSYDDFLSQDLYRINQLNQDHDSGLSRSSRTSPPVGAMLKDNFPEVISMSRLVLMGEVIVKTDQDVIREKNVLLADSSHFTQFNYDWAEVNKNQLELPFTVTISEASALKIFGTKQVLGRTVEINSPNFEGTYPFTVAGVFRERPANTHLPAELLLSYSTLYEFVGNQIDQSWNWDNVFTYVELTDGTESAQFTSQIKRVYQELRKDTNLEISMIPVGQIHTSPDYSGEFETGVDSTQLIYILVMVLFILLMTNVNYLNLFLVRTVARNREMALRSVMGSSNSQIVLISAGDSLFLHFAAGIFSLTAIQLLSPLVTQYFPVTYSNLPGLAEQVLILTVLAAGGVLLSVIIIRFKYYLTNWTRILSGGRTTASRTEMRWYGGLLALQFIIALFFLGGAIVVQEQLRTIATFDPGIETDGKTIIKAPFLGADMTIRNHQELLWSEVQAISGTSDLVMVNEVPGTELYWRMDNVGRKPDKPVTATFSWLAVGPGYLRIFEINPLAGRAFDPVKDDYNESVILNESGITALGFEGAQEAVGQTIFLGDHPVTIVGVIPDFYQENLRKPVNPQFLRPATEGLNYFVLEGSENLDMDAVERAYATVFPGAPFDYYSLSDHYNAQYSSDILLRRIVLIMSFIALFLSTTGIVGMSLQILKRREKEMIIRKIHGARTVDLWSGIAKVFIRIVLFAYIFGLPVAYFVFDQWLHQFAVRSFPVAAFLIIPLLLMITVICASITLQTLKIARQNPRKILISE